MEVLISKMGDSERIVVPFAGTTFFVSLGPEEVSQQFASL